MRKGKNVTTSLPQPTDHLLTVGEAADLLKISKSSLDKWRTWGRGPRFIKVERRVRYRPLISPLTSQIKLAVRHPPPHENGRPIARAAEESRWV